MAEPRSLIDTYAVYIDGQWVEPENGRYDDINPATEAVIASAPDPSPAQVDSAIAAARAAFDAGPWADAGPEQRASWLNQLGAALLEHADEFFALAQLEWGCTANERVIHVDGASVYRVEHRRTRQPSRRGDRSTRTARPVPRCCATSHSVWCRF